MNERPNQTAETTPKRPPRSRILSFYRKANGEKCVVLKRRLNGRNIIEEWTEKELLEMFRNA